MTLARSIAVAVTAAGFIGAVVFAAFRFVPKSTDGDTSARLEAMQAELAAIKDQAVNQGVVLGRVVQAGAVAPPVEAPAEVASAAPPSEAKKAPEATAAVLAEHFGDAFAGQAADPAWSQVAEGTMTREISRRLPEGSSIQSVQCRQSMCQLRSSHASLDTYEQFTEDALFGRESGLWNGAITSLVVETGAAGVQSISYIAREGQDLPVLEATN